MANWSTAGPSPQTLFFSPSSADSPNGLTLYSTDTNGLTIPCYAVQVSKSKPNLHISRTGHGNSWSPQGALIGTASFHSLSSSIDISLHGQDVRLKSKFLSTGYVFTHPSTGPLEWKSDIWTGTRLDLVDGNGSKLARCKADHAWDGSEKRRLEILVPADELFVDLVVVSAVAVIKYREKEARDARQGSSAVNAVSGLAG